MRRKYNIVHILFLILFSLGFVTEVFAAGTPAGTIIQSRSRAIYSSASGISVDTVYSAYVSITVAQTGAFNLAPATGAVTTGSDSVDVDYAVTLTNSGNGTDIGKLSTVSSKGWIARIYVDANGDGILQTNEIAAGSISQTASIIADDNYKVILRVSVPRGEMLNGEKDTTSLIVKSNFDSTKTVSGRYVTTVQTAMVPLGSGLTVNNPNPTAGSNVTYTFSYTNTGAVPVNGFTVSNVIPGELTFVSGSGSQGTFNGAANPVVWNVGTVSPGATVTLNLTVQVKPSIIPGTILSNYFSLTYTVGANNYSGATNTVEITVGGIVQPGVEVTAHWKSLTKEASDTAVFRYKIRNSGSMKDVFELTTASTHGYNWTLYRDANNNELFDVADQPLVNTNAAGGIDVDSVAAGDSVRIFARAIIPRELIDQTKDSLIVTGISSSDNTKTSAATTVTTINVPVVSLEKNVFPVGDQPAGATITYSIAFSNTGSASVANFSVIDTTPAATEYVANSVKINGTAVADNTGQLSITDDGDRKIIAVNIGALTAGQSGSVEFKVKIK